jgi:hypothetical protein
MMRKTLVRLGVAIAATAAPLALMAPAAHAIGGCNLGDGIDRENGSEWQERADENGGWYNYVCQDGTPVFTGYSYEPDDNHIHVAE